ncbi:GMC oxidoreductase [Annulohypoxylon maeteangense]|uniref:GMC oxidoreductase n=1 Tax=Annulohypoxylon maeteangense TaxID=1927788 RepID=UPI002007C693|nr:GMC oxidoreductase [Annulohypoxylon maeteangense]KAI0885158.1 GMC oxidoreductase [Annulohypoxylon maeteangense]
MADTYDFVIVGSGPAGSSIASSLAKSAKKPKVLLLEAGGKNDDKNLRVDGQRWMTFQNKEMNWGYKTTPQEHCAGRELDYSRGLGLGGSSAVNFSVFNAGAVADYEEWARIMDDDAFNWPNMQRRFKTLESFDLTLPAGVDSKYAAPKAENHGSSGPLKTSYVAEVEKDLIPALDLFEKAGFPLNPDHNSGNPIGMALGINSSGKGVRSTAADLLTPTPENLTILTHSPVQRIIIEGKKAVGVESNGKKYLASKEVILSAGSLNDPKILMHSGIGPKAQLEKFGLPIIQDVPAIGQGLRDHMFVPLAYQRTEGETERPAFYGDHEAMSTALEQWKKDGTGPWAKFGCELLIGWFKLPHIASLPEFQALSSTEQNYQNQPTVPHYEIISHFPLHHFIPSFPATSLNYSCLIVFLYNAQSRGEVTLQSADPAAAPLIDPKFLSTPYDRRAAVEIMKEVNRFLRYEGYAKDTVSTIAGPAGDSDEELLEYWRQNISSSWHMTGTAKMGRPGDADAAVDKDFRLMGIDNLRVADMSVVPVLASCHVQTVAYLTGLTCAEKLIAEYDLA